MLLLVTTDLAYALTRRRMRKECKDEEDKKKQFYRVMKRSQTIQGLKRESVCKYQSKQEENSTKQGTQKLSDEEIQRNEENINMLVKKRREELLEKLKTRQTELNELIKTVDQVVKDAKESTLERENMQKERELKLQGEIEKGQQKIVSILKRLFNENQITTK